MKELTDDIFIRCIIRDTHDDMVRHEDILEGCHECGAVSGHYPWCLAGR